MSKKRKEPEKARRYALKAFERLLLSTSVADAVVITKYDTLFDGDAEGTEAARALIKKLRPGLYQAYFGG